MGNRNEKSLFCILYSSAMKNPDRDMPITDDETATYIHFICLHYYLLFIGEIRVH